MKYLGGGMNMEKYKQAYNYVTKVELTEADQQNIKDKRKVLNKTSNSRNFTPKLQTPENHHRIHSKQASVKLWDTLNKYGFKQEFIVTLDQFQRKEQLVNSNNESGDLPKIKQCQYIDGDLRRTLSQQSKHDFVRFVLVQKAAQTRNQKLLMQLKRDQDKRDEKGKKGGKMKAQMNKRNIKYLQKGDENDGEIKQQIKQIFAYQNDVAYENDQPLDVYIKQISESRGTKNNKGFKS